MRIHRSSLALCTLLSLLALSLSLRAQPIPWVHPDGTTHYYEVVDAGQPVSFADAQLDALQRGGHLATLTSPDENAFVFALVDTPTLWHASASGRLIGPWLGARQRPDAPEPDGEWKNLDGSAVGFTAWGPGEPLDATGDEDHLAFFGFNGIRAARWCAAAPQEAAVHAYVIEWSARPPAQTMGLTTAKTGSSGGYTLLPPLVSDGTVHLLDERGLSVHTWTGLDIGALSNYLLEDGSILRSAISNASSPLQQWNGITVGGLTGRIQHVAWDGTLLFQWDLANSVEYLHHDIEMLPNGNILAIRFQRKTLAECIAAGRDPATIAQGEIWSESIIEIDPNLGGGTIVWEWNAWDHLIQDFDANQGNYGVVENHPERIDVNYFLNPIADWLHFNTVAYNAQRDEIMITVHTLGEVWVIDHSTTTAEAASSSGGNSGKGGDLLYRWGNPEAYRAGGPQDKRFWGPHDAHWIPDGLPGAGNIIIFNNGLNRPGDEYSSVEEWTIPLDANGDYYLEANGQYGPSDVAWKYEAHNRTDFYSRVMSGAQRLWNGNTLITAASPGIVFEVSPAGMVQWDYLNPVIGPLTYEQGQPGTPCFPRGTCAPVFKTRRYPASYPAFAGRDLSRGTPVEDYSPQYEARFGDARSGTGPIEDVFFINGSAGDIFRRMHVTPLTPLDISIEAPGTAASAEYVLFVYFGEATPSVVWEPFGLGSFMAFPLGFFAPAGTPTFPLLDSTGLAPYGPPIGGYTAAAPVTIPTVYGLPGTYTLQGLIQDPEASGPGFSITNAIELIVLP